MISGPSVKSVIAGLSRFGLFLVKQVARYYSCVQKIDKLVELDG